SSDLFDEAKTLFPGGVNSPVRYYEPYPIYFRQALGARIFDVEGNEYIDFCMGFGTMIGGYGNPMITMEYDSHPYNFIPIGVPGETEIELGKEIKSAIPSIQMMRFTNSGTEAVMHAIRLARAYTGRNIIIKMNAGFHGANDYVLVNAGSGALTFGTPSSPGIPRIVSETVIVADFNNVENLEEIFAKYGDKIAAVLVEPVLGNIGVIPPEPDYLENVQKMCNQNGSLFILD
ncbi:glutamate-1-semialdehyde-2,1-aminomutase, partial [mine drainage metagenome]